MLLSVECASAEEGQRLSTWRCWSSRLSAAASPEAPRPSAGAVSEPGGDTSTPGWTASLGRSHGADGSSPQPRRHPRHRKPRDAGRSARVCARGAANESVRVFLQSGVCAVEPLTSSLRPASSPGTLERPRGRTDRCWQLTTWRRVTTHAVRPGLHRLVSGTGTGPGCIFQGRYSRVGCWGTGGLSPEWRAPEPVRVFVGLIEWSSKNAQIYKTYQDICLYKSVHVHSLILRAVVMRHL